RLRAAGLSGAKARAILALAQGVVDGSLPLSKVSRMADVEIVRSLSELPGIGEWTAQMFLMFSLGRQDVLAGDDLGIRQAIQRAYELSDLPNRKKCDTIGESWRPYASMACWYLWRSLDIDG
ncbi:MAG: hypothetical protein VB878_02720, partial [Pirellulaceae bacterium]